VDERSEETEGGPFDRQPGDATSPRPDVRNSTQKGLHRKETRKGKKTKTLEQHSKVQTFLARSRLKGRLLEAGKKSDLPTTETGQFVESLL